MKKKQLCFVGGLVLLCVLTAVWALHRPVSGAVTKEGLEGAFSGNSVYANVGEACWLVSGDGLWEMLDLEQTKGQPAGEPGLILQMGDGYLLKFYPENRAVAYFEYASFGDQEYQTYIVPAGTEEALTAYILENGTHWENI